VNCLQNVNSLHNTMTQKAKTLLFHAKTPHNM
jgi:hypothetical protein